MECCAGVFGRVTDALEMSADSLNGKAPPVSKIVSIILGSIYVHVCTAVVHTYRQSSDEINK